MTREDTLQTGDASTDKAGHALAVPIAYPRLTLFAFQHRTAADGSPIPEADLLWERADEAVALIAPEPLGLLQGVEAFRAAHGEQPGASPASSSSRQELLSPNENGDALRTLALPTPAGAVGEWEIATYPLRIHDHYALDITVYGGDSLRSNALGLLNPEGAFLASSLARGNPTYIGQTLLLYGHVEEKREPVLPHLAMECAQHLVGTGSYDALGLELRGEGSLLGGPLFSFDTYAARPADRCHILVWFATSSVTATAESDDATFQYFDPLLNLLVARAKILYAVAGTERYYQRALAEQRTLKGIIKDFCDLDVEATSRSERIRDLKRWLQDIPRSSVEFTESVSQIQVYRSTIDVNRRLYKTHLATLDEQIQGLRSDAGGALGSFLDEAERHLDQCDVHLDYLLPNQSLHDQAIATIRGFADAEAREHQIAMEKAEGERERRIEGWLAAAGLAIAISSVAAAVLPHPLAGLSPSLHPTLIAVFEIIVLVAASLVSVGLLAGLWRFGRLRS